MITYPKRVILFLVTIFALLVTVGVSFYVSGNTSNSEVYIYFLRYFDIDELRDSHANVSALADKWSKLKTETAVNQQTDEITVLYENGIPCDFPEPQVLLDKNTLLSYVTRECGFDATEVWIVSCQNFVDGYILIIEAKDSLYFMPLLNEYETFNGFADKKIYNQKQFSELCEPKECELYIDNFKIDCDQPPLHIYDTFHFPLRAILESLGCSVEWDMNSQTIYFSNEQNQYSYVTDDSNNFPGSIIKNEENVSTVGVCHIINNRTLVSQSFLHYLSKELNFSYSLDYSQNIVNIETN